MAAGNPFGQPLFNRLGIGAPSVRAGSPLSSVEPNYNGFVRSFDGVNGLPSNPMADVVYQSTLGPEASLTALNQRTGQGQGTMARVPGPDPFNGRPVPLLNPNQLPPGFGPSVVITGNERIEEAAPIDRFQAVAGMSPEERVEYAQGQLVNRRAKSPQELALYDSILKGTYSPPSSIGGIDPTGPAAHLLGPGPGQPLGQPGDINLVGSPNNLAVTGVGMFPLPPPVNNPLNPNRPGPPNIGPLPNPDEGFDMSNPMPFLTSLSTLRPPQSTFPTNRPNFGGGLSNMAFPTLAPSKPSTFTGAFGGNNPMNNNPMNGGGVNNNQPLSQQIPQVVQQAVTPLLQNTASQLNQGIGSMVNQSLVGGGGQTGFGGTPLPSNMSSLLLGGGGFNPFR